MTEAANGRVYQHPATRKSSEISTRLPRPPARRLRVLLTGATGYIASQLLPIFRGRYDLVLLDVRTHNTDGQSIDRVQLADLVDGTDASLRPLFEGVDAVVHLGYYSPPAFATAGPGGEGRSYLDVRPNIDMAERVYRLALEANVGRVVMASSNLAAQWYEPLLRSGQLDVLDSSAQPKAADYYGWVKIAKEALGFTYACGAFGRKLGVVQIRIGAPRELDVTQFQQRSAAYKRELGAWFSTRDIQQLFTRSIETEHIEDDFGVPFQIFYGISDNTRAFWSIANAARVIGYAPEDDSEVRYSRDIASALIGQGQIGRLEEQCTKA